MQNKELISTIESNMEILKSDIIIKEAESIILELISADKIKKHLDTSRGGLNIRRAIRAIATAIVAPIPVAGWIYAIWFILSEGGIVSSSEKRTFIRFQGLTDMHIKRISKSTNVQFYQHELVKIKDDFSNMEYSNLEDAYYDLLGRETALVVAGYIRTEIEDPLDSAQIDKLSSDIIGYKFTTAPNTGLWNRFKTTIGTAYIGVLNSVYPLQSYLGHFQQLSKLNRTKSPSIRAVGYLKEYLKKTNKG